MKKLESYRELKDDGLSWNREHFSPKEARRFAHWIMGHYGESPKCHKAEMVIARATISGIGENTIVRCDGCQESSDVTDYDIW